MLFTFTVGDYTQSSHRISQTVNLTVDSKHSRAELLSNFNKNVKLFGFSPKDVTESGGVLKTEVVRILSEAGMTFRYFSDNQEADVAAEENDMTLVFADDASEYHPGTGNRYEIQDFEDPAASGYTRIVMFFLGHGLDDFSWSYTPNVADLNKLLGLEGIGEDLWLDGVFVESY